MRTFLKSLKIMAFMLVFLRLISKYMNQNNNKNKPQRNYKKPQMNMPKGGGFWMNILTTIIIFLIVLSVYSFFFDNSNKPEEIAISQLATDVSAGLVSEIIVKGDKVEVLYADELKKETKKEVNTAITETLTNYGVALNELEGVVIKIENPSGIGFYLLNFLPFLIPLLFIIFFIWYLSRQVKGAGMQAFTFGQSKARFIDPKDKNQRITFFDVAGAKEAKEELFEIVEFLKNPKKFLDIGARIPKGVILMGLPGTGKCVTGETLIPTNKGLIEIKDIPKYFWVNPRNNNVKGAILPTFDVTRCRDTDQEASHWYDLGEQETRKITLKQGMELEGTPEHPVVVMQDDGYLQFKKMEELKEGDHVAIKFSTNIYGVSQEVSANQSYIMGLLTGDGNLSHSSRIGFTSVDKELVGSFKSYINENYPDTNISLATDGITHQVISWGVKKDLYEAGMSYLLSYDKTIPPTIMQSPRHVVIAFLQGLFDSDGYFSGYTFGYTTVSKRLSDQVMSSLLNFGIIPRRMIKNKIGTNRKRIAYEITISGTELEKFSKEIGFRLPRKQESLNKYIETHKVGNTNVDLFPNISSFVDKAWKELSTRGLSTEKFSKLANKVRTRKRISRNSLKTFVEEFKKCGLYTAETTYLQSLLESNLFFSPISAIEKGHSKVYDFTVPKTHSFVSNGFISHNTLLARAVAGEAGVPFFSISGSEFVEMFVGVGASRVRDLFKMAKKSAPAIIFIDEIDAVGRVRGTGVGGGNDEREQTLNQILVEMDGFEPNEKVIIMAATNRPDVLDPALLRPGRFDRRVRIDLPDREEREAILKIHAAKKPLAEDVNLRVIAERTPGLSGADLQSIMNESAILTARESRKQVSQFDLIRSIEKVIIGPERKSHLLSDKEKRITAYHEAGHALVASVLEHADPVHKVSIISRGHAAGYTMHLPIEEKKLRSKKDFLDNVALSLGGYVTEKMVFDDLTTGPSNDLKVSTAMVRDMVTRYGMSEKIGPIAILSDDPDIYGRTVSGENSIDVQNAVSSEVHDIMKEAQARATKVIKEHRKLLDIIANALIQKETLERDEFEQILLANGVTPKNDPRISVNSKVK
jgi:ATP-dependent metalloprotease FtsH